MARILRTTEPSGTAMRVRTHYHANRSGRGVITVTAYAFNGVRYIKAQQLTVSVDHAYGNAHKRALREAFGDRPYISAHELDSSEDGATRVWAVVA